MGNRFLVPTPQPGMILISTTTLSGATTTISNIPQAYKNLYVTISAPTCASAGLFRIAPNGSTNICLGSGVTYNRTTATATGINFSYINTSISNLKPNNTEATFALTIDRYSTGSNSKAWQFWGGFINASDVWHSIEFAGTMTPGAAITSLQFSNSAGNLTGGTVTLYGVN